ncbi:uncharacterized protein LOC122501089 [Leptopilina heterotoma]|uniref:uncharacterized protein LOC122501089 n=1 Tax=Leptopilina heterotoma TaxID=63436 RepID=UPI001CA93887|nr:uncharacterized protein LOC122501089 [Leptopilina heterotoma]
MSYSVWVSVSENIYGSLIRDGVRRGRQNEPIAQRTVFGWTILGPHWSAEVPNHVASPNVTAMRVKSHDDLVELLERFWVQEEIADPVIPENDHECERLFQTEHCRDVGGRYTVRLPRRSTLNFSMGESLTTAKRVLSSMLLRMKKEPRLSTEYTQFMTEYERLGHMRPISDDVAMRSEAPVYYIPHHAIWQSADGRPKIRVVFNASKPTSHGTCTNTLLHSGPKLQNELTTVLMRWRFFRIVFCADIEMMYRQVRVHEADVDLQRIVWKRPGNQLADDAGDRFPVAAKIIRDNTYVDDFLAGADSEEEALECRDQLIAIMNSGGFHLKKWISNSPSLLDTIPSSHRLRPSWRQIEMDGPVGALGISWDPISDEFRFKPLDITRTDTPTKRSILATVARLFDPVGWLAPIIIVAKVLMQDLWRNQLDWDDHLPATLTQRWLAFIDHLPLLSMIRCPRWIGTQPDDLIELHGFGDASAIAYAAVVFLRIRKSNGTFLSRIVASKTRVAPVKTISIPRLELCAAVLVIELLTRVITELRLSDSSIYAWSDSQIVLHWLRSSDPSRWPVYIANRVSKIQRSLPSVLWHYIPTKENPADIATRGTDPGTLSAMRLWWHGPSCLEQEDSGWPLNPPFEEPSFSQSQTSELPSTVLIGHLKTVNEPFSQFSTLMKLLRCTAWCMRIKQILLPKEDRSLLMKNGLQATELQQAFLGCVYWTQHLYLGDTLRILEHGKELPRRHSLASLHPFIDAKGILRVDGRLENSPLPYDQKNPVILPGQSHLAELIIDWAHKKSLHGGSQLTYSYAIRRAWIIKGRVRVKAHVRRCITCARTKIQRASQLMGQLPAERVTPSRPFERCGVDYAGPFLLKTTKGRGYRATKGYIALFVCLSVKAVHLEVVGDLTSDSFLAALRRLIGRRGAPSEIWSDNATTFHGAEAELRLMLRKAEFDWGMIHDSLANQGVTWKFIPPGAPHFGGLWEAGIKTAKSHMRRIIGTRTLTYEEMSTLVVQIEGCMNSRPLVPVVGDLEDLDVLTPGHILTGGPLSQLPESLDLNPCSQNDKHWHLVKKMRDLFWTRWSRDYLHTLQQRNKWTRTQANIRPNDIVLVIDPSLMRANKWPLGRVQEVFPGPDGLVRTVRLRTAFGTYERPIHKISPLPILVQEQQ